MMDRNLTITYANADFFRIEEQKEDEIVGIDLRKCTLTLLPAEVIPLLSSVTPGVVTEREFLVALTSGNRPIMMKIIGTLLDSITPGIIVIFNDISWE